MAIPSSIDAMKKRGLAPRDPPLGCWRCSTPTMKEAQVERYASTCDGQQYVGIDLHRRRTVVVRPRGRLILPRLVSNLVRVAVGSCVHRRLVGEWGGRSGW
jgi:hypothetical protein